MGDTNSERRNGAMERHIQTVLISIVVGAITYAATYFFNDKADKAVLGAQMTVVVQQVAELRADVRAMNSTFVTKDTAADHEARIRANEAQIAEIRRLLVRNQ